MFILHEQLNAIFKSKHDHIFKNGCTPSVLLDVSHPVVDSY